MKAKEIAQYVKEHYQLDNELAIKEAEQWIIYQFYIDGEALIKARHILTPMGVKDIFLELDNKWRALANKYLPNILNPLAWQDHQREFQVRGLWGSDQIRQIKKRRKYARII